MLRGGVCSLKDRTADLSDLRFTVAIVRLCLQSKPQGQREETNIQKWQAIAGNGEGQDIRFGV